MSEHTPEPWQACPENEWRRVQWIYDTDDSRFDHIIADLTGCQYAEGNLSRIVACVNACAGIDPKAVKELVAACQAGKDQLAFIITQVPLSGTTNAYNKLETVLAKVKGVQGDRREIEP